MAISPEVAESTVSRDQVSGKPSLVTLMIAMVAAVAVCLAIVGGTIAYLIHSGRFPMQKSATVESKPAASSVPPSTHAMVLEPIVANLAGSGTAAYLKVSLTLRIADEAAKKGVPAKEERPAKGMSEAEAAVRDTVLTVIGRQTAESLLAPDGKERLRSELKTALARSNPELKVIDVYFTDFLVQQ